MLPWLAAHGLDGKVRHFLAAASSPFDPWIRWAVSDAEWVVKFPVNSVELSFIAMLVALLCYVTVSLLTCRRPFNLEKMLHRDEAQCGAADGRARPALQDGAGGKAALRGSFLRRLLNHVVGITPEYRREDRILAWVVFGHSIVYGFVGAFALVAICAKVFHWSVHAWAVKSVWFAWGTTRDLRRLFRDLEARVRDDRDNGMVEKSEQRTAKS